MTKFIGLVLAILVAGQAVAQPKGPPDKSVAERLSRCSVAMFSALRGFESGNFQSK